MIEIQPIQLPNGIATNLVLKCLTLDMTATTAQFYYALCTDISAEYNNASNILLEGNLDMTESEYTQWGADNSYCIQWAANKLNLTIK
jgi:hypothetical protein